MPTKTALGGDWWSPADWKRMPRQPKLALLSLLRLCEANATLPQQVALAIIALLFKAVTDDRAIGLLPMSCRLWAKTRRQDIAQWSSDWAASWDDARAGTSAARAVFRRSALDDSTKALGLQSATLFVDMRKFYDSVRISHLLGAALGL